MARYLATTVVNGVNHHVLLQIAVRWWGWPGGASNAFAASVAVFPAYWLSKRWVWEATGPSSVRHEIGPFWALSALGLITSTTMAEMADRFFDAPILISVASVFGYLVVWVFKFVALNVVFNRNKEQTAEVVVA